MMYVCHLTVCTCDTYMIFSLGDLAMVFVLVICMCTIYVFCLSTVYPLTALPARLTDLRDLERDLP